MLAETLPPHCPYNCPIETIMGKEVPFGHVYALSHSELVVQLKGNLAHGFIDPPASLAGAPMISCQEEGWDLHPCVDC